LIGEPLTHDTGKDVRGTAHVASAQGYAVVVAEIKLSEIAVKVLLIAMLIDATHAALEHRELALDGVGVNDLVTLIADVFFGAVLGAVVAGEGLANLSVEAALIGH
jgi:hypothetical protein